MRSTPLLFASLSVGLLTSILLLSFTTRKKLSVEGNWAIVEVETVKADGSSTSVYPKESLAIFSHHYYSFCWTSHIPTTRSWALADSVKLSRLNQSIVNTGTFELQDSILTTKARFAMNPMFVAGEAKFRCSTKGDTLILTGLSVMSAENIPNPLYAAGSHIVNKLVRVKE